MEMRRRRLLFMFPNRKHPDFSIPSRRRLNRDHLRRWRCAAAVFCSETEDSPPHTREIIVYREYRSEGDLLMDLTNFSFKLKFVFISIWSLIVFLLLMLVSHAQYNSTTVIHFWAPTFKWGHHRISIANITDFAKPLEKISYPQQVAVTCTGLIWSRYSMVITHWLTDLQEKSQVISSCCIRLFLEGKGRLSTKFNQQVAL